MRALRNPNTVQNGLELVERASFRDRFCFLLIPGHLSELRVV
jgi:hypothetical protein